MPHAIRPNYLFNHPHRERQVGLIIITRIIKFGGDFVSNFGGTADAVVDAD